jgi:hypothetical protein
VVKRQKGLNYTGYPEKGHQTGNKHKHFPLADFGTGKIAFSKYYTDNKEDNRLHQLEKLKTRNIINYFYSSQILTET